jgi:hypothetical protein
MVVFEGTAPTTKRAKELIRKSEMNAIEDFTKNGAPAQRKLGGVENERQKRECRTGKRIGG